MEGLDVTTVPFDLIVNILNIVILYVILRFLVYKPVKKFLTARTDKLAAEKEEASRTLTEAKEAKEKYTRLVTESETKAAELLRESEREAKRRAEKIVSEAETEAARLIAGAETKINAMTDEAYRDMRDEVVDLSIAIASKLIERNITSEDNRRIAQTFFESEAAHSASGSRKE